MIILGIDPGIARIGWAIIQSGKSMPTILAYGLITTPKTLPSEIRLADLFDGLLSIIRKHNPDIMSVEDLFFATNAKTAIGVGQARGVILLAAAKSHIPVISYTPLAVKRTITGNGRADKKQVEKMIIQSFCLTDIPKIDDTIDAIAIAATHAYTNGVLTAK